MDGGQVGWRLERWLRPGGSGGSPQGQGQEPGAPAWGREGWVWSEALGLEPEAAPCAGCVPRCRRLCPLTPGSAGLPCPRGRHWGWGAVALSRGDRQEKARSPEAAAALERVPEMALPVPRLQGGSAGIQPQTIYTV